MEDRNNISLRSGKRNKRPTISAPLQISGPIAQDDTNRPPPPGDPGQARPRPRPPPMAGGKVSLLERLSPVSLYSHRLTDLGSCETTILDSI
jgi:hypothetical protein